MKAIIFIVSLLTLCSCNSTKKIVEDTTNTETIIKDSTVYREYVHVDTVKIKADSINANFSIDELKKDVLKTFQSGRLKTTIIYRNGEINLQSTADSLEKIVFSISKELSNLKEAMNNREWSSKEVVVKKKSFAWIWLCLLLLVVIAIIGFIIYKKIKK